MLPWHLQFGCPALETTFRKSEEYRRVLLITDALACVFKLLISLVSVVRVYVHGAPHDTYGLAPNTRWPPLATLAASLALRCVAAASPLVLLWARPAAYHRHRLLLAFGNRALTLACMTVTLTTPVVLAELVVPVVRRLLALPARKALSVALLHPSVFYTLQACFVLPWHWAALFQAGVAALLLNWMRHFPCFLQQALFQAGGAVDGDGAGGGVLMPLPVQQAAQEACHVGQGMAVLVRTALGDPLSTFSGDVCHGPAAALTVLQVFAAFVLLLVVPVLGTHSLERWLKLRFCRRLAAAPAGPVGASSSSNSSSSSRHHAAAAGAGGAAGGVVAGGSSLSPSSRSRAGAGRGARLRGRASAPALTPTAAPSGAAAAAAAAPSGGGVDAVAAAEALGSGHAAGVAFLLLLVLPVAWLLAEAVTESFHATTDCDAVLRAAGWGAAA